MWSQAFVEEVQGYSCNFGDIALVMRDAERLMAHWRRFHAEVIREVHYEQVATDAENVIADLAVWLGLPAHAATKSVGAAASISTASLWQARQPVYTRSVERWRNYAEHVPELLKFAG